MPFLLQYLLKLSLTLAVLYLFYYVLLRKLTFCRWNRFYLLCYSLLSFVIPFINITPWIRDQSIAENNLINTVYLINKLPAGQAFSFWPYISALFMAGVLVMLARLVMQFVSIQSIRRKATLIKTDHGSLYDVDGPISPFSFAHSIFINTRLHSEEELQRIIQHEFVHVKQQHTIDLLTGELLCIVNWYNPFAWLIKKAIRQNLEFIADNSVLQTGIDARQYQYMLLKVTGVPLYSVSSNFNISSLKERIVMINKLKSASVHLLKFMFILPLLAIMLLAFRDQQERRKQEAGLLFQKSVSTAIDTVPDKRTLPKFKQPRRITTFLKEHQEVADVDWSYDNMVTIRLKNGKSETYDLNREEGKEGFKKKYGASLIIPPPPPLPGEGVRSITKNGLRSNIVNYVATVTLKNGKEEVYDLRNVKQKVAYERKYGKIPPPPPPAMVNPQEVAMDEKERELNEKERALNEKERTANNKERVAFAKEGVMNDKERAAFERERIINEKKRAAYQRKYGKIPPPPPQGVQPPVPPQIESLPVKDAGVKIVISDNPVLSKNPPLYVLDGVIQNISDMDSFDPDQISSIDILKGENATRIYGDKANYGVVLIASKGNSTVMNEKNKDTKRQPEDKIYIGNLNIFKELFIVDGKEISREKLNDISGSSIESINVLKDKSATSIYGDKGKDGVIEIKLKQKMLHLQLHDN